MMKAAPVKSPKPGAELRLLHAKIAGVRARQLVVSLTSGIALAVAALAGGLTLEMIADWLLEIPWLVRLLIFLTGFGGFGFLVWKKILTPFRHRPNDDTIALMIERAFPVFQTRMIAAIQLARAQGQDSPVLVAALLAETAAMAKRVPFERAVKKDEMKRWMKAALGAFAAAALFGALSGHASVVLLRRAFLFHDPLPRKTQILHITGDRAVGVGDDLTIEADAQGVIPAGGRLLVKGGTGGTREFPMEAAEANHAHFLRVMGSIQESFSYAVRLNDATSEWFRVAVVPRPAVVRIDCEQVYPPYTKLGTAKRAPGDLTLLAGSRLRLKIQANTDITKASARLTGVEQEIALAVDPKNRKNVSGEIPIPAANLTGFSLRLIDERGVESRDVATYRIELVPDKEPTVKITYPDRREELVTPRGAMLIAFEASDDFGVARASLHYIVDAATNSTEKTIELDLGKANPQKLARRFEWKLDSIKPRPPEGSVVDYWVEVQDTNNVTGPGKAATERHQARVVSEEEKRADLANRMLNAIGGLNDLTKDQESISAKTGELIFAKPPP